MVVQGYLKEIYKMITNRGNDYDTKLKKKQRKKISGLVLGYEQQRKRTVHRSVKFKLEN